VIALWRLIVAIALVRSFALTSFPDRPGCAARYYRDVALPVKRSTSFRANIGDRRLRLAEGGRLWLAALPLALIEEDAVPAQDFQSYQAGSAAPQCSCFRFPAVVRKSDGTLS